MKNVLRQLGKAACYGLLFVAMQAIVSFVVVMGYSIVLGMEAGMSGEMLDAVMLEEKMMAFTMASMNWMVLISSVLTILVLWLFFKVRKKQMKEEIGMHRVNKEAVVAFFVLGIGISFLISCVLSILPIPESLMEEYIQEAMALTEGSIAVRLFTTVILGPITEEIVFRGLVLSRLKKAMKPAVAILITSVAFGLLHGQLIWIVYTTILGIVFAIITEKTHSITPAILTHMGFNFVGLFGENVEFTVWQTIIVGIVALVIIAFLVAKRCWYVHRKVIQ